MNNYESTELHENHDIQNSADVEPNFMKGAEMLESPTKGGFLGGLQEFVDWVRQ